MSAQQLPPPHHHHQVEAEVVPSEDSIDNISLQWPSSSTTHSVPKDDDDDDAPSGSSVDNDSKTTTGCFPILHLFKMSFLWKRGPPLLVDNRKLLADLKTHADLVVDFFEGCLTPKLKLYAEQMYFPRVKLPCGQVVATNGKYSLPTAQVWTATYILKLCSFPAEPSNSTISINTNNEPAANNQIIINSNSLRRSLTSLLWEVESAKAVVHEYHSELVKFANEVHAALKKLRTTLLASSKRLKLFLSSLPDPQPIKDFDLSNKKQMLELKLKKDKAVLELNNSPSLLHSSTLQFSLSVDTKNTEGCIITRNQDCTKVAFETQQKIIGDLFKAAADAIKRCECLLDSIAKRISSGGLLVKSTTTGGDDDVTCCRTLSSINVIVTQLLSSKNVKSLDETDQRQLYGCGVTLFEKWSDYFSCSQWIMLKFYELCDMIALCYQFTLKYSKMNIPELELVQKEVNVKSKFQKDIVKSRSQLNNLKTYAIRSLIEECNAKGLSGSGTTTGETKGQPSFNLNPQSLLSTMYHLAILDSPLEIVSSSGWYTIVLRPTPDLERVDSDMILSDRDYMIALKNSNDNENTTPCHV